MKHVLIHELGHIVDINAGYWSTGYKKSWAIDNYAYFDNTQGLKHTNPRAETYANDFREYVLGGRVRGAGANRQDAFDKSFLVF